MYNVSFIDYLRICIAVWFLYCINYVEDNMPIQRHVIMTNVTRIVSVSKCTL